MKNAVKKMIMMGLSLIGVLTFGFGGSGFQTAKAAESQVLDVY